MKKNLEQITWTNEEEFCMAKANRHRGLYFPLMSESGLKSAVTPDLRGDAKIDQNHFLIEPASIENLTESMVSRNFWCNIKDGTGSGYLWSATGCSHESKALKGTEQEESVSVACGFLWHLVERNSKVYPVSSVITSFIPFDQNTEIHIVTINNTGSEPIELSFTAAIPLYGRSADNIRDHRHVTSLLNRITAEEQGVFLTPTMSFDERGHKENDTTYFVVGTEEDGTHPVGFFPTIEEFVGEEGDLFIPEALIYNREGKKSGYSVDGREAMGGLSFAEKTIMPGKSATYIIGIGVGEANGFPGSLKAAKELLFKTKNYWKQKMKIRFTTGDRNLDGFLRWVSFQPQMRRVFGCSFLPHHDYGRGGRGWRDLWQDCLALLLQSPEEVRNLLINNCGGVRLDGTNATIIGDKPGEFKADRNAIPRVWMDHGMWPLMTVKLYLDETGDLSILQENAPYFKDNLIFRGEKRDENWDGVDTVQKTVTGEKYLGSVLEHLLIQNITAMADTGEHGILRLRGADWNDALDMAGKNGESVAFTFAYVKNLRDLADILRQSGEEALSIPKEVAKLLSDGNISTLAELRSSYQEYLHSVESTLSGEKREVSVIALKDMLLRLADEMTERLQKEWLTTEEGFSYFNSYYDNNSQKAEGFRGENGVLRMMLTGQVFAAMSHVATKDPVKEIVKSADALLFDEKRGGYSLNSDFGEIKMDMGRMFGFAYGEKENGAVFSHMAVMFANALYDTDKEAGAKALHALFDQSMNTDVSHIYPGIPEYFDQNGRGLYHYLTGAASWYLLTVRTKVYGISGNYGDLRVEPALTDGFFGEKGIAKIIFPFRGIVFHLCVEKNEKRAGEIFLDEEPVTSLIQKEKLDKLDKKKEHGIYCFVK